VAPLRVKQRKALEKRGAGQAQKGEFNQHHRHNYGQLLILNVGGGYHVLLAGMERVSVHLGQLS
jgi:hypothetical protein